MEFEKQEIEMKINNLLVNGSVIDRSKLEESGCVRPFFFLFIFYGDAAFKDRSMSTETANSCKLLYETYGRN